MKRSDMTRVRNMIETDRLGLVTGSEELIKGDITALLGEYFCIDKSVKVKIIPTNDRVQIEITADCSAVKRFNLLK